MSDHSTEEVAEATIVPAAENVTDKRVESSIFYDPDNDFRNLALDAQFRSKGFRLVSKDEMVGVPHVIIGVTYRPGFPRAGEVGDYVSVEAIVADSVTMESAPVKSMLPADLSVWPNEPVVYNDSGTGVRRELTKLLHSTDFIDVGSPASNDGENIFDRQFQLWRDGEAKATTGISKNDFGGRPLFLALRGLRRSDYESPYGPATTFYFG